MAKKSLDYDMFILLLNAADKHVTYRCTWERPGSYKEHLKAVEIREKRRGFYITTCYFNDNGKLVRVGC